MIHKNLGTKQMDVKLFFSKKIATFIILLVAMAQSVWAQSSGILPMKVDAGKAKITQVGHATTWLSAYAATSLMSPCPKG